jgi:hypothetical protein
MAFSSSLNLLSVLGELTSFNTDVIPKLGLSSIGFSLWGFGLARTKIHRLKPVLQKTSIDIEAC